MTTKIQHTLVVVSLLALLLLACGAPAAAPPAPPTPYTLVEPTPLPPVCTAEHHAILQAHQQENMYVSIVEISRHIDQLPIEHTARVTYVQQYLQDVAIWTQTDLWTLTEQPGGIYLAMPAADTPALTIAAADPANSAILLALTYALSTAPPAKPVTFVLVDPAQPLPAAAAHLSRTGTARCITTQQHDSLINCLAGEVFRYGQAWQPTPPCYLTGEPHNFAKLVEKFIRVR